jgi:GNAT superfamily N-acetyltransferase
LTSIISDSELVIKPLNKNYDLSSFTCKDADLNDFLKKDALNYHKHLISKTSLCFFGNELAGYITLTFDTIGAKKVSVSDEFENKYSYPAMKIARLAVNSRFERRGVGTFLLYAAIGKALSIGESVGCRFVLLDSKKDSIGFYKKYEFKEAILKPREMKDNYTSMYFDLQPVLREISSYAEGKGDSTANLQLLDYNEKKK